MSSVQVRSGSLKKEENMTLLEILEENPQLIWSNNGTLGTDKHGAHDYVNGFYNEEFKKYQDKEINLLEIGIFTGGSLCLWSKYFTKGNIYGLDIQDIRPEEYKNLDRVTCMFVDGYQELDLPDFDIVIDDGPHSPESMIRCIELYLPKLKEGGVLVIEDLQDPSWFLILTEATPDEYKDKIQCLDIRENLGRGDDLMFIIRK